MSGCSSNSNNEDNKKHYTIEEGNPNEYEELYQVENEEGKTDVYIIARINKETNPSGDEALLYRNEKNDYIYLYTINTGASPSKYLSGNKLYVFGQLLMRVYTLNKENTKEEVINFKIPIEDEYMPQGYYEFKKDYIYYILNIYKNNEPFGEKKIKCSINSYECVVEE